MTEKRFTIESERINNTYSIHIYKDDKVIFEISNWDSLSSMHKKECEDIVDLLNEQQERILTLEKFLIMKNREINNSIILSDEFKELWNGSLKKFVGELE